MKRILIYGDSNTWGDTTFSEHGRLARDERWAGILADKLGDEYETIDAGMPGRTAGSFSDELYEDRDYNGQKPYNVIFKSASPVDLVILALGTNDINSAMKYDRSVEQIIDDILWYEGKTHYMEDYNGKMPEFLYLTIPNFVNVPGWYEADEAKRVAVNNELKTKVKNLVELPDVGLTEDGVHLSVVGHQQVVEAVYAEVEKIFKEAK